jgi:basic membrane lipoprotein Med (substrate-binding protein (PBP1-ABC) superfamily)
MSAERLWRPLTGLLVAAVLLAACGQAASPTAEPPTAEPPAVVAPTSAAPTELRVAALLSIGLDSSWDKTFYESFQRVQQESPHSVQVADLAYTEGVFGEEAETVLQQYAETGQYDIIFAQASFTDQIKKFNQQYPDILWVVSGSGNELLGGNVYNIYMRIHEPSYLEGMLAGYMTDTNVIGVVGLFPADDVNDDANAFIAGAKAVNPEAQAKVTFIESWYDPAKAREATLAQIAAGADHILQGGEVYDVCAEKNIFCYARYEDVNYIAPEAVLTSALGYWDPAIRYVIDEWWKHETTGQPYNGPAESIWFSMKDGASGLAPFHDLEGQVPQDVKDKIEQARQDIMEGTLVVPLDTETPVSD